MSSNKDKARARRLMKFFKLSVEDHARIREFQASHKVYQWLLGRREGTDHSHATGLVRGILEWRLNRAYGAIEALAKHNTAKVLRALAEYHENPPAVLALGEARYGILGKAIYKKRMKYGPPDEHKDARKTKKKA